MKGVRSGSELALGAAFYILAGVQFAALISTAAARYGPPSYSPVRDTISDLQAVACGQFQGSYVCSPLHWVANLSVALLGALIALGTLLIRPSLPEWNRRDPALALLAVAGVATFVNAFTPEDVTYTGDLLTALIAFLCANIGLIQIGRAAAGDSSWRWFSLASQALGAFGMAALFVDGLGGAAFFGEGAIEWMIVVPVLVWAFALGVRLLFRLDSQ